jgi:hypothetical protein
MYVSIHSLFFLAAYGTAVLDDPSCTIPRLPSPFSSSVFLKDYKGKKAVIFNHPSPGARHTLSEEHLRANYGHLPVTLASSNSQSYAKLESVLAVYLDSHMAPVTLEKSADSLWYLFGDTLATEEWMPLHATINTVEEVKALQEDPLNVWGVGGQYSGVPFHTHGPVFSESVLGRKRWFISPPQYKPTFSGNVTTLSWVTDGGPLREAHMQACTAEEGDVLYLPLDWWHATLNLSPYNAFTSTFTKEPAHKKSATEEL